MPLKIELKPYERVILGDCVVTNQQQRTRLVIEGKVPILREKDIMTPGRANTPAKRLYLAVQAMYVEKEPQDNYALYLRLAHAMLKSAPATKPYIDRINNRILTGELYKALKETRKLIAHEEERLKMHPASKAYTKTAKEIASPRELEANLLLNAAAKLQSVHDSWKDKPVGLNDALMYNRRLWTVFIDALVRPDNKLPAQIRENLVKIGAFVMGETFSLMTQPQPKHLKTIIKINRRIAAGLNGRA
jgi:flagellar biosynthesis repressor protein FlbT